MTKFILILATSILSFSAQADYFHCELKSSHGFIRAETEAEYRQRYAVAADGVFSCEGQIVGNDTHVTVTSLITGESESASERASMAQVQMTALSAHLDTLDTVTCTCGMR